jgi:hypothetical protein
MQDLDPGPPAGLPQIRVGFLEGSTFSEAHRRTTFALE